MQPALGTSPNAGAIAGLRDDADDMNERDWQGLEKFFAEEAAEPEHAEDDLPLEAAGVAFLDPDSRALFVRYGPQHARAGEWSFPGGGLEDGERPIEAAHREAVEEVGRAPGQDMSLVERNADHGADYSTFVTRGDRFVPTMSDEHDDYVWAPTSSPPQPLHPGVAALLAKDAMSVAQNAEGKLSERTEAHIGTVGSKQREELAEGDFLEPASKKYPVKEGGKYSRKLLLAAAREARMHGHEDLARRADAIREREFGAGAEDDEVEAAMDHACRIAMDRESVRDFDNDGRMHVQVANISKAAINPYVGKEIPGWQKLGLDPDKIYRLFRDPDELAKGASTFNGIQLLKRHEPVSAEDHRMWDIVGTTGTDANFDAPYLRNSLHVWTKDGIGLIESGDQREISCGYHYDPDMTPGEYDGQPYDGVMRNIRGNHVALVKDGRAGSDVVVGDDATELQWSAIEAAVMEVALVA